MWQAFGGFSWDFARCSHEGLGLREEVRELPAAALRSGLGPAARCDEALHCEGNRASRGQGGAS